MSAPVSYRLMMIGKALKQRTAMAVALNNKQQAIVKALGDIESAYLWSDNTLRNITSSHLEWGCWAYGLNDEGTVVGGTGVSQAKQAAFYWKKGRMTLLPGLEGRNTWAAGITNEGIIYGVSYNRKNIARAVCWKHGKIAELKIADTDTFITSVNSMGAFTGYVATPGKVRTFICQKNSPVFLSQKCISSCVNAWASIVGTYMQERDMEPFVYANPVFTRIPTLSGGRAASQGINSKGWVVGLSSLTHDPIWHGFLWCNNQLYDLNRLLKSPGRLVVKSARAINDRDVIAGSALIDGKEIACLLVPER